MGCSGSSSCTCTITDTLFVPAGPPLPANTPVSLLSSAGYVRDDNSSSPAYTAAGTGDTAAEQFVAISPSAPNSISPIQPGQTAILQSVATGQYCRLAPIGTGTELGMVCDQPTAATATPLTYTGSGLSYAGVPLVATSAGAPLVLANTTTTPPGPDADNLAFKPAGESEGSAAMPHAGALTIIHWQGLQAS